MINVRPDFECTPDGRFVYFVSYIAKTKSGAQAQGWVTLLMPRKVRNVKDIILLNDTLKSQTEEDGFLSDMVNPVVLNFQQIEAFPEDEDEPVSE